MKITNSSLYIIAEIANAAQGIVKDNFRIIDAAASTGADGIKFQFYKYDEIATPTYDKFNNFQRTFYSEEERISFIDYATSIGLDVFIDIFDAWGLEVAKKRNELISGIKIPASIILNEDLVEKILDLGKTTLIGVGGYEDSDIDFILSHLKGRNNPVILMHGFQGFPTEEKDSSISRIHYLKKKYQYPIGFADHIDAESDLALRLPEYAYFAGATVIEKHITLNREKKGLDYYSSLMPDEFKQMVDNLKRCEKIMGSHEITLSEKDYLKHSTRVTTLREIKKGDIIFNQDIKLRRTDKIDAMFPNQWKKYSPAVALKRIGKDDGVCSNDIRSCNISSIIGCRMHSTRLPKKAILEINGVSSIERCLINACESKLSQKIILATSTHPDDSILENYTLDGRAFFFRGAEKDLVKRFIDAANEFDIDIIIRITGDRPLISPELIDCLIESHLQKGAEFSYYKNAPLGTNPEVINTSALKRLKSLIKTDEYSEYLTLYFINNGDHFRLNEIEPPEEFRYPEYRLVLDHPEDMVMFQRLFSDLNIKKAPLSLLKVMEFLRDHPDVSNINNFIKPKYRDKEFADLLNKVTTIK